MKKVLFLSAVLVAALAFTSCKKNCKCTDQVTGETTKVDLNKNAGLDDCDAVEDALEATMATMGYDVTSVAYWKNKYSNSDFSNPFANRYLMDQVKQAAEEYHKSRQAGQFGKSRVSESQIAQLVGEELSAKQIKDIFGDIGTYAKDQQIEDEDLIKQCLSGSIDARYRLRQIDETHYAFLHTDGKLHTLEKGKDIIFDSNGNIKEISVNGSTGMDGLDHFLAAFTQIVPTVGKLGALLISIPDIFTNNMEAVTDRLQAIDAWANSDSLLSDLYRLDHIDMDGFNFEGKDILMTSCDILGMLAGNWAVGKIATLGTSMGQLMVDAGAKTGNVALKGLGQAAGTLTKGVSSLALRSTGWYSGVSNPTAFTMFGKELVKPSVLGMWLNHGLKVAPIYAMKDYYNSVSQMNQTNISLMLQGKDAAFTQEDINERALKATGINYGLNMLFASAQGLTSMERFGLNKQTHNWDIIRSRYSDNKLNALAQKMAEGIESPAFRKYMMATKNIIGLNSMGDIFATVAGNQIQAWQTATTEDGKAYKGSLIDFLTGDSSLGGELGKNVLARKGFWKDLVQTSIMQASEYARNKREAKLYYYSGINMLGMAHSQYMTKLQEQIDKTSDPAQRDALQTIKNHQLQMVNDPKNGDTVEQRILKAMDYECQQIGDMPPELKKIFDNLITNDKQEYYKLLGETIEYGRKYFKDNVKQDKLNALGDKKHLWNKVGSVKDRLTNYLRGNTFKGQDAQKLAFLDAYEAFNQTTIDQYYAHTGQLTANKLLAQALTPDNIKFDDIIEMSDEYKDRISPDYPNEAYFIYKIKQEAELNESASKYDQPRLKGKVFRTTMDLLAEETPGAVIKLDDNTYAMFSALDPITESFTLDTQAKINHALLIMDEQPALAANIITSTLLGDEAYNAEDLQPHYDSLMKVLTFATKNGIMTDVEAADLVWRISEEPETQDAKINKISNKMHDYLTSKVFDPSSKGTLSGASDIEKCLRVRNALSILSSKPKGTTAFNAAWNLIFDKDNKLTNVADAVLEHYDPSFKKQLQGSMLKDGGGRFPLSDAYLSEELLTPVNKEIGAKVITSSDEEIALYYKKANKDKFKVFFAEKDKLLKDYDDNTVKHEASGTIVSINLAGFSGKSFKKAFSIYKAQKEAHQTEGTYINHDVLKNDTGMISEYKAKADLAQEFDSTVLNFDLNDPTQFETFKDVARTLKLFGDNDSDYTYMTLDSAKKNLRNLKDGWDNDVEFNDGLLSYVKLDDKVQNKLIKNFKDIKFEKAKPIYYDKDGNEHVYDLPDKIAQVAEIHKVSSKVRRIKNADEDENISILALPFGKKKDTKSYASIEYEGEGERGKQGTQSKKATGGISFDALESADEYERNRDLGSYYYIRNLIDKADDRTYRFSYYGDTDKIEKKLTSLNIIGNSGFYEVDPVASADGMLTIRLKADAQEKMLDYLETSNQDDFNLFRIIPLISDKPQGEVAYLGSDIKEGKISFWILVLKSRIQSMKIVDYKSYTILLLHLMKTVHLNLIYLVVWHHKIQMEIISSIHLQVRKFLQEN